MTASAPVLPCWPLSPRRRRIDERMADRVLTLAKEFSPRRGSQLAEMLGVIDREARDLESILQPRIMEPVFALVYEALRRVTGMRLYHVQLMAGAALAQGSIAEMKTGEGKTIVVALPAVLHALRHRGVHVATTNAYLATRDFELLEPAYAMLGLTAGLLKDGDEQSLKNRAYACDITYGTGYELGFDYLRDQLADRGRPPEIPGQRFRNHLQGRDAAGTHRMQTRHGLAIVDEADSVLLDEANTPLVISQELTPDEANVDAFCRARALAERLRLGEHFTIRHQERSVVLLAGVEATIFHSSAEIPRRGLVRPWRTYLENALRARYLLRRDADYVVVDGAIRLVDPHTGRVFTDRTWQDGLHQAVECAEGLPISAEKNASARISRQRYFGFYEQLCGMTGTATGSEREFQEFYRLPVVVIPERLPSRRLRLPTLFYTRREAKHAAIVMDIRARHSRGQPVLAGTWTIEESERLSELLQNAGMPSQILNGKQDADEAELVARAGQLGAITIATNMAGRGTDIAVDASARDEGGLHVILAQVHECRRVDRQLMGRGARQGEPGSCQAYVSLDDDLMRQASPRMLAKLAAMITVEGSRGNRLDQVLDGIQRESERRQNAQRADVWRHDQWLTKVLVTIGRRDELSHHPRVGATPVRSDG